MKQLLIDWRKWIVPIVFVMVILTLPLYSGVYVGSIVIMIAFYSILAIGQVCSWAMRRSFSGGAAFFGLGAYVSAVLVTRYALSPWLGLTAGAVVTGVIAYGIGRPLLSLPVRYMLGVATMAVNIIFVTLFGEMDSITGGWSGLGDIQRFSIGGLVF